MSQPAVQERLPAGRPARRRRGLGNPWLTLFAVAIGVMMVALDGTIVAIANPAIAQDLDAVLADVQWITNGYLLALAVTLITAGKLGDRFGHRQTFLIGVVGFAAASGAIGLSGSIGLVDRLPGAAGPVRRAADARRARPAARHLPGREAQHGDRHLGHGHRRLDRRRPDRRRPARRARQLAVGLLHQRAGRHRRARCSACVILRVTARDTPRAPSTSPASLLLSGAMFCPDLGASSRPRSGAGATGDRWRSSPRSPSCFAVFAVLGADGQREPLLPLGMFRSVPLSAGVRC